MKKALVFVLAVALVFGFSTLAMAEEPPTQQGYDASNEAFDNGLRDNQTALDAKAVHIGNTILEQGFVEDNKQETPAD